MHRQGQGRTGLTSSASRSASPPPSSTARAASSSPMSRRCPAILMTATRWQPSSRTIEALIGNNIERLLADDGYRGHNAPPDYKFRVYTSRPEAPRHPADQTRDAPPLRRRTRHRPSQKRAPHGPQLSLPPSTATPTTPSSPPSATTSAASSGGSGFCCAKSSAALFAEPVINPA